MSSLPATFAEDVINQPARAQFEAFLDEHRSGQDGGTVLNRSVIPGYRDSEMTWALTGRSPDAGTRHPGPGSSVRTSAVSSASGS
jgi:hypothetical protein